MGLFDTIRRAVGSDDAADGGGRAVDETAAASSSDDGPTLLDTRELDPAAFREHAETVVENAPPLEFSTDALSRLDAAIAENYDGRTAGPDAGATTYTENTVRFGSYLGEVLVRSYDAEWVDRDGRWAVVVSGADDEVTVPVFDVAVRSFGDEPVFDALAVRLESTLDLDAAGPGGDDTPAETGPADERDAPSGTESTAEREPTAESDSTDEFDEGDVTDAVTKPTRLVDREDESDGRESGSERTADAATGDALATDAGENDATGDEETPEADDGPDRPSAAEPTPAVRPDEADESPTQPDAQAAESTDGPTDEGRPPERQAPDSPAGPEAVEGGADGAESETDAEPEVSPDASESAADPASDEPSDATGEGPPADAAVSTGSASDRSRDGVRAEYAETAVDFAGFWGERDLDFSPASLSRLDDLVAEEWDGERFAETTFGSEDSFDDRAFTSVVTELGSYFGEVLVRHLDGEWTADTDHDAAVVVGGTDARFAVPVYDVAITSLRERPVFGRSYDALLSDLGRDGPTR